MEQAFLRVDDAAVHAGDEALVLGRLGPVGGRVLEPYLRAVEEEVELLGRVVLNLLVEVEEPAMGIAYPAPSSLAEGDVVDGVFVVEAFVEVDELVEVELANLAQSGAPRAAALGVVEAERLGIADEGLSHAREEQSHEGVDVGVGAHGGARVVGGLALVDDDGDGQSVDGVDVRPSVFGQVLLYEGGEGVVELAPRLGGDGVHHERALARARDAGEDGNLVLGNIEGDILEVVLAGTADGDMGCGHAFFMI